MADVSIMPRYHVSGRLTVRVFTSHARCWQPLGARTCKVPVQHGVAPVQHRAPGARFSPTTHKGCGAVACYRTDVQGVQLAVPAWGAKRVSGDLHCVRCQASSGVIKRVALRDQAHCLTDSAQTHTPFLHRVANEPPALIELRALHALAKACANATEAPVRSHLKIVLTLTRHIN